MDGLDWIVHPLKSELNFSHRPQEQAGLWSKRWAVPLLIPDGVFCALETQAPQGGFKTTRRRTIASVGWRRPSRTGLSATRFSIS